MSQDWIKMRVDLLDDPAVIAIATETGVDEYGVVGRLHKLWCWADRQTVDGNAPSVTEAWLDRYVSVAGFARAMEKARWLSASGDGLTFPHFDKHNGKSAKKRALTARRATKFRNANSNAASVTQALPEKEKEKEKEKELTSTSKTKPVRAARSSAGAAVDFRQALADQGIPEQVANDWLKLRNARRAPVTQTALAGIEREAGKAGMTLAQALSVCCERGWIGFKAEWVANAAQPNGAPRYDRDAGRRAAARAIFGTPQKPEDAHVIVDITPPVAR